MIDQARYKAWRSGPEPELHVIVYEGADLPPGISGLGPWLGSKEGEVAHIAFPASMPKKQTTWQVFYIGDGQSRPTLIAYDNFGSDETSREIARLRLADLMVLIATEDSDVEALKREALEALAMEYQPRHRWGEKPTDETE